MKKNNQLSNLLQPESAVKQNYSSAKHSATTARRPTLLYSPGSRPRGTLAELTKSSRNNTQKHIAFLV